MPSYNSALEIYATESRADTIHGVGVNCITGGLVVGANALSAFTKLPPVPRSLDRETVKVIKSSNDYNDFMNANASVSVKGLSWAATATVSFASQNASSDTAMSYVAVRDVRSSDVYLDVTHATISEEALTLLAGADGPAQFLARYGTHCVIGVSYGGSYSGYLRLDTSSASHKESLAASLQASASGFGVSGSVNAAFSSGLSTASTGYSLSCDSCLVGATLPMGVGRSSPDDVVNCANNITLVDNPSAGTGVKGAAISFICVTWDEFPQIAQLLDNMDKPNALSLTGAMGTLTTLSAEYAALNYVIGTCRGLLNSGDFALPGQRALAGRLMGAAAAGQHAIQALTLPTLQTLSTAALQALLISPQLNAHLQALSHNQVRIQATWHIDQAFVGGAYWDNYGATVNWPLGAFQNVATVQHGQDNDPSHQRADLKIHIGNDPLGYYLVPRWQWQDGTWYDGPRLDIGGGDINPDESRAVWPGAEWNFISARLANYP